MRFLRYILLLSCFGLLLNAHLSEKTKKKSSWIKAETKRKTETACSLADAAQRDAVLSRSQQINLPFFKTPRQNQLFTGNSFSPDFISQPSSAGIQSGIQSGPPVRLHLIFCVMRC